MTVDTGARLLGDLLPLGERLVVQHVGVAALLAKILRERIASPHGLEPRILFEPRLRDDRARIDLRRRPRHRLAAAVACPLPDRLSAGTVVLQRKVLAPDGRILGVVGQLDDAVRTDFGLLLRSKMLTSSATTRQRHQASDNRRQAVSPTPLSIDGRLQVFALTAPV